MGASILLDTNAVILFLQGRGDISVDDQDTVAISIISEIELLGWVGISPQEEAAVRQFLGQITILPLCGATKDTAISLRRNHRL
jgi:predicted nucleic acid-binding protein